MKIRNDQIESLQFVADEVEGELTSTYSGRGMFGKICYGIICDNHIETIEEAAINGITGAKFDQLGLGFIVYWPDLSDE